MRWLTLIGSVIGIGALFFFRYSASGTSSQEAAPGGRSSAPAPAALPKDVHPESLSRIPLIRREAMDDEGKRVYDVILGPQTRTLAGLQGPYGIWLHSPKLGESLVAGNQYLRFQTGLGRRLTELAILVTAREMDQQFEWTAHEPEALKEGLEQNIIDVVKHRKDVAGLGEKEALIIRMGRELLRQNKLSSQTYAQGVKLFGVRGMVELSALIGNYAMTAVTLNTFDQQLRPGMKPLLPIP